MAGSTDTVEVIAWIIGESADAVKEALAAAALAEYNEMLQVGLPSRATDARDLRTSLLSEHLPGETSDADLQKVLVATFRCSRTLAAAAVRAARSRYPERFPPSGDPVVIALIQSFADAQELGPDGYRLNLGVVARADLPVASLRAGLGRLSERVAPDKPAPQRDPERSGMVVVGVDLFAALVKWSETPD